MPSDALKLTDVTPPLVGWRGEALHDADAELDRLNRNTLRELVVAGLWPERALQAINGDDEH